MFKFSVIIPIYNIEEYLEDAILSVVNQSIGFEKNIQLILINDGSTDKSEEICKKYLNKYPNNIIYKYQENSGVSAARNEGIALCKGELVNFMDGDDKWSLDTFKEVYNQYKRHKDINLFSCKLCFFDAKTGNHPLNYKYKKDKIVDIMNDYEYIQLAVNSIFVKTSIVKKYKYLEGLKHHEDTRLINEIILDEQKYMVLKKPIYHYRRRVSGNSAVQGQTKDLNWYFEATVKSFEYLVELSIKKYGYPLKYIQYLVLYELHYRIEKNKICGLTEEQNKKYIEILEDLINAIDEEVILNHKVVGNIEKLFFLKKKQLISKLDLTETINKYLKIDNAYIRNNKIEFYGKINQKVITKKDLKILNNGNNVEICYYDLSSPNNKDTFDGGSLNDNIGIKFVLDLNSNSKVKFIVKDVCIEPKMGRTILTHLLPRSYHHINDRTIYLKKDGLFIKKRNFFRTMYYELLNQIALIKKKRFKSNLIRLFIKIFNIFKRKEIWLISDRIDSAGDNGEYFFKYMINKHNDKNKKLYYVLSKESSDYERMSKIGKVLDPQSKKYKMLFQISDYIISSHCNKKITRVLGKAQHYIQDLYHFKYIFLQHGVSEKDISSWLNINSQKIDMFVSIGKKEYDYFLKYKYYYGENVFKITGFPRYDALLEKQKQIKTKKQIMLACTWRANLAKNEYNPEFKNSDYCKFINKFMNDKRLLKVLEEKDYKIKFCPHPRILAQLEDFNINKFVEVEKHSIDYQREFCENKLLITDYSSVSFDFAYLNKPVIYYQADKETFYDGQVYNEGYFKYETQGFGPVYNEYDKLIDGVIKYIQNDCEPEKQYENRVQEFFEFYDNKNCERVYNEIKKDSN